MSDSDNKAISIQVQLKLDLPTGTELGNSIKYLDHLKYEDELKYEDNFKYKDNLNQTN